MNLHWWVVLIFCLSLVVVVFYIAVFILLFTMHELSCIFCQMFWNVYQSAGKAVCISTQLHFYQL